MRSTVWRLAGATLLAVPWTTGPSAQEDPGTDYNSPGQEIIYDYHERQRLLANTPQWAMQLLSWPDTGELEAHLGQRAEDQIQQATEMLGRILQSDYIPAALSDYWIPLRDWNIFYTDWVDHGGADAFLTNYMASNHRFQIADTPNFVIVAVRTPTSRPARSRPEEWATQVVSEVFTPDVQPRDPEDSAQFRIIREPVPNEVVEGDWAPRGPSDQGAEPSTSASVDIDRVKFFTDGQCIVLSIPKFLWDPTSLVNPFADRFPAPRSSAEVVAMRQMLFRPESATPQPIESDPSEMTRLLEELLQTTPSDVLLEDWARRTGADLNVERLAEMFDDMSAEERGLWLAQQLSERLMAEGARAMADERYDEAATRFGHVLVLDPLNVSAAWLLEVTRARARDRALRTEQPLPLPWFRAADQLLTRHRNTVEERRIQSEQRSRTQLELRDLRTQWLEAYAEKDLRRARQILHRMLDLDPGNASTLFFADLIERLLAAEEGETNP